MFEEHQVIITSEQIGSGKYSLVNLPEVLSFQINRSLMQNGIISKENSPFIIPSLINMNRFYSPQNVPSEYFLNSILMHSGSLNSGHYYLYVYDFSNSRFIKYDDEIIKYVSIQEVIDDSFGRINPNACSAGAFYIRSDIAYKSPFEALKIIYEKDMDKRRFSSQHGPMDFIDLRNKENLEEYTKKHSSLSGFVTNDYILDDASTSDFEDPPCFVSTDEKEANADDDLMDSNEKRLYIKTSLRQKKLLMNLYQQNGDNQSVEWYSLNTAIRLDNCKKFLSRIRRGEDISVTKKHTGRKRKIMGENIRLVESTIKEHPHVSCNDLRILLSNNSINCSRSTVWRCLTQPIPEGSGKVYSFKKLINRAPICDTEENKNIRYMRCKELDQYISNGFQWVCIDETRFEVGYIKKYGWGPKGTRTVNRMKKKGFSASAITAISSEGFAYCQIIRGSVTASVFSCFLNKLREQYPENADIVIWLDNASIHKAAVKAFPQDEETKERMEKEGKRWIPIIFNAAYSPELNPIENIFGIWKCLIEEKITRWNSEDELIDLIANAYMSIDQKAIRKAMERVRRKGFKLVSQMKDLNDLK